VRPSPCHPGPTAARGIPAGAAGTVQEEVEPAVAVLDAPRETRQDGGAPEHVPEEIGEGPALVEAAQLVVAGKPRRPGALVDPESDLGDRERWTTQAPVGAVLAVVAEGGVVVVHADHHREGLHGRHADARTPGRDGVVGDCVFRPT